MLKKTTALILALLLLAGLAACAPTSTPTPSPALVAPSPAQPASPTPAAFTAGEYTVETEGHNGPLTVTVTFSNEKIEAIVIGENTETRALGITAMEMVRDEILARQSLDVDMVSGATISSAVLRAAVSKAVEQAGGDPKALDIAAPADTTVYEDVTVDVVVVGSGSAGMTAAVEANLLGLNVILVEQLGQLGGSSVRAGYMIGAGTRLQAEQGIPSDPAGLTASLVRPDAGEGPLFNLESAQRIASMFGEDIDWLQDQGVQFGPVIGNATHYGPDGERAGGFVIAGLQEAMEKRGVDYRVNTTATEILMKDGKCVGVKVTAPNKSSYSIYGNVVLATGGYFGNQEMVKQYNPEFIGYPTDVSIGADGSGMRMAEAVGGVLIEMNNCNYHGLAADYRGGSRSLTLPAGSGAIAVNAKGERFVNEATDYTLLTRTVMAQPGDVFCIMDQGMMDLPNIKGDHGLSNIIDMYEIANTPEELAQKLGIDPAGLADTVAKYIAYAESGEDLDFAKPAGSMRSKFNTAPYYGVKSRVETHTVYGGILIDKDTRVLDTNNVPITGLYAIGETAASHMRGGATNSICVAQGRIVAAYIAGNK